MSITIQDVEYVARLARIALSEEEKKQFTVQLARILDYINQLSSVDTTAVEPMAQPLPLSNVFRDDTTVVSGMTEALLANAPEREGAFIKVKKVIE